MPRVGKACMFGKGPAGLQHACLPTTEDRPGTPAVAQASSQTACPSNQTISTLTQPLQTATQLASNSHSTQTQHAHCATSSSCQHMHAGLLSRVLCNNRATYLPTTGLPASWQGLIIPSKSSVNLLRGIPKVYADYPPLRPCTQKNHQCTHNCLCVHGEGLSHAHGMFCMECCRL